MYLMLLPGVLTLILFSYIPMGGIIIAFQKYNIFKGIMGSEWVGLKNFESVFSSPIFLNVLKNTLIISLYKLVALFPVTIFVSLLLNEIKNRLFKRSVQTLLYIPFFISWVVISGIMLSILSPNYGIVGDIYRSFKGWYTESYAKSNVPPKKELYDYLIGHDYKIENGKVFGVNIKGQNMAEFN